MLDTLRRLERDDPNGWETREPTAADHAAFEARVLREAGPAGARTYFAGGWDPKYNREV